MQVGLWSWQHDLNVNGMFSNKTVTRTLRLRFIYNRLAIQKKHFIENVRVKKESDNLSQANRTATGIRCLLCLNRIGCALFYGQDSVLQTATNFNQTNFNRVEDL